VYELINKLFNDHMSCSLLVCYSIRIDSVDTNGPVTHADIVCHC